MYNFILVPVDVYEIRVADKVLLHAQFLAQASVGNIHLLYVTPRLFHRADPRFYFRCPKDGRVSDE